MEQQISEEKIDAPVEAPGEATTILTRNIEERLSLDPPLRIALGVINAGALGLLLGFNRNYNTAALRFRAENAHRLPKSQKGWYFYHRSKNYTALDSAGRKSPLLGLRLSLWTGLFLVSEQTWDDLREKRGIESKDLFSTLAAGFMVSGVYSVWNRFSVHAALRTVKMGTKIAFAYGLAQDAISLVQGRRIRYVEIIKTMWES